jgi:hypothetical protein
MKRIYQHNPQISAVFFTACSILALGRLLRWIAAYGVDFPFFDEWIFLGDFISHYVHGGLASYDLLAPHNEHRIATTRLTYILLYHLTALDRRYAFAVNWLFAAAALVFWYLLLRHTGKDQKSLPISLSVVTTLLTTSPHQLENWTWGFQVQWFQHVMGLLMVVFLVTRERFSPVLSFVCAVWTTFTISAGQLLWPLCFCVLLTRYRWGQIKGRVFALWLVGGAVILALYRHNLPAGSFSLKPIFSTPLEFFDTYLVLLGAAVARSSVTAARYFGVGLLLVGSASSLCILFRALRHRNKSSQVARGLEYVTLVAFGLASALMIALARHSMGGAQYVFDASRYTTLTTVTWIASFASLFVALDRYRIRPWCIWGAFGAIAWGYCASYAPCHRDWAHRHWILESTRAAVLSSDPAIFGVNPDINLAAKRIGLFSQDTLQQLYQERLTPFEFAPRAIGISSNASCGRAKGYIDRVERFEADGIPLVRVSGWAFDSNKTAHTSNIVVHTNSWLGSIPPSLSRPDVQSEFPDAPPLSGWSFVTTPGALASLRVGINGVSVSEMCVLPLAAPL